MRSPLTAITEENFRILVQGKTAAEIAKNIGCDKSAVYRRMKQYGIPKPGWGKTPSPLRGRKTGPIHDPADYAMDWETDPVKQQAWAYVLGVYMGDGCCTNIGKGGLRKVFAMGVTDVDFRDATAAALRILTPYATTCSRGYDVKLGTRQNHPLACGDQYLCRKLIEATGNKTRLPYLPPGTERQFIIGLMDSEGSVGKTNSTRKYKNTNRQFSIAFKQCFYDHDHKWIYDFHALIESIGLKPGKIGIGTPYRPGYKTPYRFGISMKSWIEADMYFNIKRKEDRVQLWASLPAYHNARSKPIRLCTVPECTNKHLAKGYCSKHYDRRKHAC